MAIETHGLLSTADGARRRRPHSATNPAVETRAGALEVALLRRSLAGLADQVQRCGRCARTLLTGERVYEYATGQVRCELCRDRERQSPAASHRVHGSEYGHSIRVIDRRAAR